MWRRLPAIFLLVMTALASARADEPPLTEAEQIFSRGAEAMRERRFDEAAQLFLQAFFKDHEPRILFYVGQAYRAKGDATQAIRYYRAYVELAPDTPDRAEVIALLYALEHPPEAKWYGRPSGWVLAGGGLVMAGVATYFFVHSNDLLDQVPDATDGGMQSLRSEASLQRKLGTTFAIAGGLALASGVVIFMWPHHPSGEHPTTRASRGTRLLIGAGSIGLAGEF